MSHDTGTLYIVATPIGNLEDISYRAARLLAAVDLIAAEDTRHSRKLLQHYAISTRLTSLHEHNERSKAATLVRLLLAGKCIALISDAGTPLISDPGLHFVRAAQLAGVHVVPVPGPCAAIAALSVAGLPSDRFSFEGFPPNRAAARAAFLQQLSREPRTLIFFESPHRIVRSLEAMVAAFGAERPAALARELTKVFETIRRSTLAELREWVRQQPASAVAGEFVVLVQGASAKAPAVDVDEAQRVLRVLLDNLPLKQAVALTAQITGHKRRALYQEALALRAGKLS
jgi:16S rRNA (cytidine1402-2'-O)-methyltransferase